MADIMTRSRFSLEAVVSENSEYEKRNREGQLTHDTQQQLTCRRTTGILKFQCLLTYVHDELLLTLMWDEFKAVDQTSFPI